MKRILYLFAMYSGLRAAFNRWRSSCLPQPIAKRLDHREFPLNTNIVVRIRVHARYNPRLKGSECIPGMFSVSLVTPGIHPITYRLWQLTSHFGCGHIELAFFEEQGVVHLYAVRNILRSNMERAGFRTLSNRLALANERDEIMVLKQIMQLLDYDGLPAVIESPEVCVDLAVTESLLDPQTCQRSIQTLLRKYRRINKRVEIKGVRPL
jgi:hypothetical protein